MTTVEQALAQAQQADLRAHTARDRGDHESAVAAAEEAARALQALLPLRAPVSDQVRSVVAECTECVQSAVSAAEEAVDDERESWFVDESFDARLEACHRAARAGWTALDHV